MSAAFQANAFQNSGFQTGASSPKKVVGWHAWHDPVELERRLKEQRDNTFSRRRFDELVAEAQAKVEQLKSKPAKAALRRAIEAAQETDEPDDGLSDALEAAVFASKTSSVIRQAQVVYEMAMSARASLDEDEEEIELLLLH